MSRKNVQKMSRKMSRKCSEKCPENVKKNGQFSNCTTYHPVTDIPNLFFIK